MQGFKSHFELDRMLVTKNVHADKTQSIVHENTKITDGRI